MQKIELLLRVQFISNNNTKMPIEYCFSRINPSIVERYATREEAFASAHHCVETGYTGTIVIIMRSTIQEDNIFELLWMRSAIAEEEEEEDIEPTMDAIYEYAEDLLEETEMKGGRMGE